MKIAGVILSAGFGSRMKKYTENTPKPMLKVAGKPILEYIITQMVEAKIVDIGLNLHFHANQITDYFADGKSWGAHLNYVYEDQPTGTAGGVKSLEPFLSDCDHFVLIYGDILSDLDLSEVVRFHIQHGKQATCCLHRRKKSNSIVEMDENNKIIKFIERPSEADLALYNKEFLVNSAIYVFKKSILSRIPLDKNRIIDIPKDIFPDLVREGQLFGFPIKCHRVAIDSEEKYLEAQTLVLKFTAAPQSKG